MKPKKPVCKACAALTAKLAQERAYIKKLDGIIEEVGGVTVSCINTYEDLKRTIIALKKRAEEAEATVAARAGTCSTYEEALAECHRLLHERRRSTTEPKRVRLTEDFIDMRVGMAYPAGTELARTQSGQYAVDGTKLGGECVAGYFLIRGICEEIPSS